MSLQSQRTLIPVAAILTLALLGSCTHFTKSAGSGGGLLAGSSDHLGAKLIEVRGYALAPDQSVPPAALGYAVPIFTSRDQAARFCPLFVKRLTFGGLLTRGTPLRVRSYGQDVRIVPFVWPVTDWKPSEAPECKRLVERYNISAARNFFQLAVQSIRANGGSASDIIADGPFIATARRVSGTVMLYDLSRAPDTDYQRWFTMAVEQLSNPAINGSSRYVTPPWRDKVRYYVFGSIPAWEGVLKILIPGFANEHAKS